MTGCSSSQSSDLRALGYTQHTHSPDCPGLGACEIPGASANGPVVNKSGYLFEWQLPEGGRRTYACTDRGGLYAIIRRLTGREIETFVPDERGLPKVPGASIAHPVHIYSGGEA